MGGPAGWFRLEQMGQMRQQRRWWIDARARWARWASRAQGEAGGARPSAVFAFVAIFVILASGLAGPAAHAQGSMAQCRAELPAAGAAKLRQCEDHAGCRAVARIVDSCPALQTFLQLLANNGTRVDDSALRRALIEAGVPAPGLASCTSDFNRALCRNFLSLEDASGETAAGPTRTAQFQAALRRLVEQQERARVPADAHRNAEVKLEACGLARPGPERDGPCREAIEAVQACELVRQEWTQRREVLLVDAQRLGQTAAQQSLRGLEMPSCAQTLPGSTLTPQQALVSAAADVPDAAAGSTGPAASGERVPNDRPPADRAPPPPRPENGAAAAAGATGGECKASLRRMEERFEGIQRRRPAQADRLAVQQTEIFMLTDQVGLLERLCRGQREYEFLRPTQQQLARTLQACRETAANPINDCVPRIAW